MSHEEQEANLSSLDKLPVGAKGRVVSIDGAASSLARRMMEMGLVPGAPVKVIKAAPLGDPLEISVHRYRLALRRAEARTITVARQPD